MGYMIDANGVALKVTHFDDMRDRGHFSYRTLRELLFDKETKANVLDLCDEDQRKEAWYSFWKNASMNPVEYLTAVSLTELAITVEGLELDPIIRLNQEIACKISTDAKEAAKKLSESGPFPAEQAKEIAFFIALFCPFEHHVKEDDLDDLKKNLQQGASKPSAGPRGDEPSPVTDKTIEDEAPAKQEPFLGGNAHLDLGTSTELPFFPGAEAYRELELELCCMENGSDEPICVTLKSGPMQRHLQAGEKLWALCAQGQVIAFLPRMAVAWGSTHFQTPDGVKVAYTNGQTELLTHASLFAVGEGGRLLVDEEGAVCDEHSTGVFSDIRIAENRTVCWGRCCIYSYGLLLSDGRFIGSPGNHIWDKLLGFDITVNQGIAIRFDRKAVDCQGNYLGESVAAVSCCADRYLLLLTDGSVQSDKDRNSHRFKAPVRAICAAEDYWIATDEHLYRYNRDMKQTDVYPYSVDEIECDDTGSNVYAWKADGSRIRLP